MNMFKVKDSMMVKFFKDELEKEMKFIKLSPTHEPLQEHIHKAHLSLQNYIFESTDVMLADDYRREEAVKKSEKLLLKLSDIEDDYIPKVIIISEF